MTPACIAHIAHHSLLPSCRVQSLVPSAHVAPPSKPPGYDPQDPSSASNTAPTASSIQCTSSSTTSLILRLQYTEPHTAYTFQHSKYSEISIAVVFSLQSHLFLWTDTESFRAKISYSCHLVLCDD